MYLGRRKLDPKAKKMILVGYEQDSKNYHFFDRSTRKIHVSRHVNFLEKNVEDPQTRVDDTQDFATVLLEESGLSMRPEGSDDIEVSDHVRGRDDKSKVEEAGVDKTFADDRDVSDDESYEECLQSP